MQRTMLVIPAMLAAMAVVSACGGAATSTTPADPLVVEGKALVSERCKSCHDLGRVQSAKKSKPGWTTTVAVMKSYGAKLTDTETSAVVAYLAATFQ